MVSPGSRNPASADIRPSGQAACRPSRHFGSGPPLKTASMIVTGSTRGKCSMPQAGQTRFQPPLAVSVSTPQAAQKPCRRRQSNSDLAVPAMAASGPGSIAAASRIS